MSILAIAGSPSPRSRANALLAYAGQRLARRGWTVDPIGLDAVPADALVHGHYNSPEAELLRARMASAQAVLIATPVYQASFAGGLKAMLDLLGKQALADKLVLPLASGGSQAHLLALEYSLKPVLSALGARHILAGVYATESQVRIETAQGPIFDADLGARLDRAVDTLAALLPALQPSVDIGVLALDRRLAV